MRFFHLTRGQRGVCGIYSTRLDCQSLPGSPSYPPSSLPAAQLPACLPSCLVPMTSYACSMPQKVGFTARHAPPRHAPPRNSLCHKNRAHCACIVHLSASQEPGVSQSGQQSNNDDDDKRLSERLIQLGFLQATLRLPLRFPLPAHG